MRFTIIAVLCACVVAAAAGDSTHLKAKAKLLARLTGKHHKRGVYSSAPPYKLGHDIPHVTHSIVKPVVVSYPPTASVTSVKVPLQYPLVHRYPVQVGHKVPVSQPHHGLKFPHHTKVVAPKPDQHYHHHHHHVAPRPVIPLLPAHTIPAVLPATPIPQASVAVSHPIPAPSPIIPATPQLIYPQNHVHLKQVLPVSVPIQPASAAPVYQYAPQYSYAIRPGNAVQTSYFATYPRYPLVNYQSSVVPLAPPVAPSIGPVFLSRPQEPHYPLLPQPQIHAHGVVDQPTPAVAIEPTILHATQAAVPHPTVHLQPVQPAIPLDNDGWSPVPHSHEPSPSVHDPHQFTQEQGHQVFEHHTAQEEHHNFQHQLHHIQQQIDQAQHEQDLHNQQQVNQGYGQPKDYPPHFEYQDFAHLNAHEYAHAVQNAQEYAQTASGFAHYPLGNDYDAHAYAHAVQNAREHAQTANDFAHFPRGNEQDAHAYAHAVQNAREHAQTANDFAHYPQGNEQDANSYAHAVQNAQEHAQPANDFAPYPQGNEQDAHAYAHAVQNAQEHAPITNDFAPYPQDNEHDAHAYAHAVQNGQEHAQTTNDFTHYPLGQGNDHDAHAYAHYLRNAQEHNQNAQLYGNPVQPVLEGRSEEAEEEPQKFHNHIPLGLQPPIDRPLEHFQ